MLQKLQQWRAQREPWVEGKWLALDIETNGLDSRNDAMLAIAWVPIQPPLILLEQAGYRVVKSAVNLNQSAVIHQLSAADIAAGLPLYDVLREFCAVAKGVNIVAHNAQFDLAVLASALKQHNTSDSAYSLQWKPQGVYCTLAAERKRMQRRALSVHQGDLTLAGCRARYGFDSFSGHQALNDAVACAELFLAQAYRFGADRQLTVKALLSEG